ncbi:YihY family inner membrane protein [Escherichia coli]
MLKTIQDKARHRTRPLWAWLKLLWQRIDEDNMTTLAGNLAYVSLLSLVPLVAVVFALFAAFPMFSDVSIQLRHLLFKIIAEWRNKHLTSSNNNSRLKSITYS